MGSRWEHKRTWQASQVAIQDVAAEGYISLEHLYSISTSFMHSLALVGSGLSAFGSYLTTVFWLFPALHDYDRKITGDCRWTVEKVVVVSIRAKSRVR